MGGKGKFVGHSSLGPPKFETTIQNLLPRSSSLLLLFRPLKNTPHIKNHGWVGEGEK